MNAALPNSGWPLWHVEWLGQLGPLCIAGHCTDQSKNPALMGGSVTVVGQQQQATKQPMRRFPGTYGKCGSAVLTSCWGLVNE